MNQLKSECLIVVAILSLFSTRREHTLKKKHKTEAILLTLTLKAVAIRVNLSAAHTVTVQWILDKANRVPSR